MPTSVFDIWDPLVINWAPNCLQNTPSLSPRLSWAPLHSCYLVDIPQYCHIQNALMFTETSLHLQLFLNSLRYSDPAPWCQNPTSFYGSFYFGASTATEAGHWSLLAFSVQSLSGFTGPTDAFETSITCETLTHDQVQLLHKVQPGHIWTTASLC